MSVLLILCVLTFWAALACTPAASDHDGAMQPEGHRSNWAVLVCTSRYWFNYRHIANTLSMYRTVKRLGIPDSHIILMLGDDMACNPRNPFPGEIFNNEDHRLNLYSDDIEVDYRGLDVSADSVLDLLTGRHPAALPASKRLLSDNASNVLVYMAGHGGDGFMKFQDQEEMTSSQLADAVAVMHAQGRYRELLLVVETCQAESLHFKLRSPGALSIAASKVGENSYSHHTDMDVGVAIIDRFTFFALEFFETVQRGSNTTMADFLAYMGRQDLQSTLAWRSDLYPKPLDSVPVTDFFGASVPVHVTRRAVGASSARVTASKSEKNRSAAKHGAKPRQHQRPVAGSDNESEAAADRRGVGSLEELAQPDNVEILDEDQAPDMSSTQAMDGCGAGASLSTDLDACCGAMDPASAGDCFLQTGASPSAPSDGIYAEDQHGCVDGRTAEVSKPSFASFQRQRQQPSETTELEWHVPDHDLPLIAASVAVLLLLGVATRACT